MRPAVGVVPDHPGRRLVEQKEGLVAVVGEGEQRERAGDRQGGAERPTDRGPRREARRPRAYGRAGHGQKRHGDVVRVPQQGPEPNVGDLPLDDDQRHPQGEQPGHGGKKVPDLGVRAAQPSGHAPKRERDEGDAHVNGAIEQPACGARQDCGLPLRGEALRRGRAEHDRGGHEQKGTEPRKGAGGHGRAGRLAGLLRAFGWPGHPTSPLLESAVIRRIGGWGGPNFGTGVPIW